MKIDLNKNFVKVVGSKNKAVSLVHKLAERNHDKVESYGSRKAGRYLVEVHGIQKNFRWTYLGNTKELSVVYTDGRPEADPAEPKNTYYIIWVEGLSPERGEKVMRFTPDGIDYTLKMTNALRVKEKDLPLIKSYLRQRNIANWVTDNPSTYFKTHYAPKGTLFRS